MNKNTFILGGGITGLAAGIKTGLPIYEAASFPGGLCSSYKINGVRFERAGGHWFFGENEEVLNFVNNLSPLNYYERKSAAYFSKLGLIIPYPVQNNLHFFPQETQQRINQEKLATPDGETQEKWLKEKFGKTLCNLFFFPFEEKYTAGLFRRISPQDKFKVPDKVSKGYNPVLAYPQKGLGDLIIQMARKCQIYFNKEVVKINLKKKVVNFSDGSQLKYNKIFSTLPLNKMVHLSQIKIEEEEYPYTSVLVVNIMAKKGKKCPAEHWLYLPDSQSGFYRVGFYSNVDPLFLPSRKKGEHVSIYAEKAFVGGQKISKEEIEKNKNSIVKELFEWQFIIEPEIVDPNWIENAYAWQLPNSCWKEIALEKLEQGGITQMGRYGRWCFQGMTDSIKEGFVLEI